MSKKLGRRFYLSLAVVGAVAAIAAVLVFRGHSPAGSSSAEIARVKPTPMPLPPGLTTRPDHWYATVDGQVYGYQIAPSADSATDGSASPNILTARFMGQQNGKTQVALQPNKVLVQVLDCEEPCRHVRSREFVNGNVIRKEFFDPPPGAVILLALDDARLGKLKQFQEDGHSYFFNEADRRDVIPAPK